ncbi:MAG: hypothetical protein R3B49_03385 [Phycisphaerales bacterium]
MPGGGMMVFLLTFVLPKFIRSSRQGGGAGAVRDEVLDGGCRSSCRAQWPFPLAGVAVLGGLIYATLKTEVGSFWFDRLKLTIPVMKAMFRSLYISRSLHTMGQLINAGVPGCWTRFQASRGDHGEPVVHADVVKVYTSVKQGKKIARRWWERNLLPKAVVQMIERGRGVR